MSRCVSPSGCSASGSGRTSWSASPYSVEPVEVVDRRVGLGALGDDPGQLLADHPQRELAGRHVGRVAGREEPHLAVAERLDVEGARAGRLLVDRAQQGRDHQQRRVGWPSRIVSRKPCTAGPNARRRIRSRFTRLMPILTLTRSAGVSRMVRAVNGSSSALPASPRLTSSTPPCWAAIAGQVVLGLSATEPWLIELPWCSQTRRSLAAREDRRVGPQLDEVGGLAPRQPQLDAACRGPAARRTAPCRPARAGSRPRPRSPAPPRPRR